MEITVTSDTHEHTMVVRDEGPTLKVLVDLDEAGQAAFELEIPGAAMKLLVEQAELNAKAARLQFAMQQEEAQRLVKSGLLVAKANIPKDLKTGQ
jgi:hypothetical protein